MSLSKIQVRFSHFAVSAVCIAALALTACSGGGAARKRDADGRVLPTLAEQDPAGTLYAASVSKASRGECDEETLDVLTCFAYRGHGYEGAQTGLGQCEIVQGNSSAGIEWITRAADSGWPEAQKLLAQLYIRGGVVEQDPVEGAKWAKLYSRNPSLLSLGVQPDLSIVEEFRGTLTSEQNALADQRVRSWSPKYWTPTTEMDRSVKRSCEVDGRRPPPSRKDVPLITMPDVY